MQSRILIKIYQLLIIGIICCQSAVAQPGWIDYTQYYCYALLNDQGRPIQFENNTNFKLLINKVVYDHKHVPKDKFPIVDPNSNPGFSSCIQINDFSLVLERTNQPVLIEIVSNKDTMHLFQPTSMGASSFRDEIKGRKLNFVPGHYYFPSWERIYFDANPLFHSSRIKNLKQENFIVPAADFNRISQSLHHNLAAINNAEEIVMRNFLDTVKLIHETISVTIPKTFAPYTQPKWITEFFPTTDKSIFYGLISYTYEAPNLYSTKYIFARYNRKTNEISQWYMLDNLDEFSVGSISPDPFNQVLYLSTFFRNKSSGNEIPTSAFRRVYYHSTDFGLSWSVDSTLQQLFDQIEFRNFEIIDAHHALAYKRETKNKGTRDQYEEGTYYLLKDKRFVDSLKSPKGIHYNSNYNNYAYKNQGDSIFLGPWGIDPQAYYQKPYTQPVLVKKGNEWKFELLEQQFIRHKQSETTHFTSLHYDNFTLTSDNRIEFKDNTIEPIELTIDFATNLRSKTIHVLERKNFILFVQQRSIIMTFDGGTDWYYFPISFENGSAMKFLTFSEENELSYFNPSRLTIEKYTLSRAN